MATTEQKTRAEWIEEWARENPDVEFRGRDAAKYLNVPVNAVGPVLAAMARAGILRRVQKGRTTFYSLAPELQSDVTELADPEFVPTLKEDLTNRLVFLNSELLSIDARRKDIDVEANRVKSALKVLG